MKKLKIEQIRSGIGRPYKQKRTLKALGLGRMHKVVYHDDTPQIRGMVRVVNHLVKIEEVEE